MIHINNLHKRFGDSHVLRGISCDIKPQEVVCIIGPSGSGKSTFLRCMNALETVSEGEVVVNGFAAHDRTTDLNKMRESVGMVFQRFNLFPHMTVLENLIMAPMNLRNMPRQQAVDLAEALLAKVGLSDKRDAWPSSLSGGQQQRVAIARALVKTPNVLLLDEPLSNLDARLRLQTREEIRKIQQETRVTTVFVTHDQEEAMSISDQIVVMKDGIFMQMGRPQEVYDDPASLFVAKFLGNPPINVFKGEVQKETLWLGDQPVLSVRGVPDQPVTVGIRPEGFILTENGPFAASLSRVEVMGRDVSVISAHPCSENFSVRSIITAETPVDRDAGSVHFSLKPSKVFLFHRETGARIPFSIS